MKKYHIVSNGLNYRVQWLGKTLILRRPKWYWLKQCTYAGSYIVDFSSKGEAHSAIIQNKVNDFAEKQGYKPIDNRKE
jgi:hypothetical protein